jgi:hypothetical protein
MFNDILVDFYVRVDREDGYFIAVLPPGKYFIKEFRTTIKDVGKLAYDRTNLPHIIYFDVDSGRANYIGTIQVPVSTEEYYYYEKVSDKAVMETLVGGFFYGLTGNVSHLYFGPTTETILTTKNECETKNLHCKKGMAIYTEDWQIKSEYEEAKNIFMSLYPDHPEPLEKLAVILPCNKKGISKNIAFPFQIGTFKTRCYYK